MAKKSRTEKMRDIRDKVWNLTDSPLYMYRKKNNYYPVLGEGSHNARIMFIGEAPGRNEAETGRPFCGAAGEILTKLLSTVGIDRKDVYITNIVKDRPPGNRDPTDEEIKHYSPFLVSQIDIIQPAIIATLGRFSMDFIMRLFHLGDKLQSISRIHGQSFPASTSYGEITIIPFFHPAVVAYTESKFPVLKKDFEILRDK